MRLVVTHEYSYFTVYHVWATENSQFHWTHKDDDGVGIGQASYYKGKLKTIAAFNPLVIGLVCEGHYEWSDRGSYPDYWTKKNEWQKCHPINGDIEWWCLHSKEDAPLSVKYVPLLSELVVEPQTSVFVMEGIISADDNGSRLMAVDMNHVKPRSYPITIEGDAKIWLIRKLDRPSVSTAAPVAMTG